MYCRRNLTDEVHILDEIYIHSSPQQRQLFPLIRNNNFILFLFPGRVCGRHPDDPV